MKKFAAGITIVSAFVFGMSVGGYFTPFDNNESGKPKIVASSKQSAVTSQYYSIKTKRRSYFALGGDGKLIPEQKQSRHYYKIGEDEYSFQRRIVSNKTALVVMDPWLDSGSEFLNQYYGLIFRNRILPLVLKTIDLGIRVFILTNDPKKMKVDYGGRVFPELETLADKGSVKILYHQDLDDQAFANYLKTLSVDTLIYSGFASNMCVIGRSTGMIPMRIKGFRLFFVPEASAAVEFKSSWKSGDVHSATTLLISQWVGELIEFDDFMRLVPRSALNQIEKWESMRLASLRGEPENVFPYLSP
jgi:hypothetical protein